MLSDLVIDALASHRLTRLVTADVITQAPRDWVIRASYGSPLATPPTGYVTWQDYVEDDSEPPKLATLVTCRWCAGFYIAAVVTVARWVAPRRWQPVARAFALSSAAALFAAIER